MKFFKFDMSSSIHVDAPAERVWKLIDEARRWPEWSTICVKVWGAPDEDGWQPGHRFGFLLRIAGRKIPFFVRITQIVPGKLIEWQSTKFTITAVRSISVEPDGSGCRVTDSKHFSSCLLPIGIAYPRGIIRKMTDSWLAEIKHESESDV